MYLSKLHETGLIALTEEADATEEHTISTNELLTMVDFVLKNNFFEFNGQIKQQSPGAAIGRQFAPPCVRLLIEKIVFPKTQELQHLVWFRYIEKFFLYLDTWRKKTSSMFS